MQNVPELVDHFFRREAGKMVAYLTRIVGPSRLDLAEDVVQDTLIRAMEGWAAQGLPDNPSAWLMRVARNRAIDLVRRDEHFRYFEPELTHLLKLREQLAEHPAAFEKEIQDDQLRMMFSCCHPELSPEMQVPLILKILCGFSVSEIAHALLTNVTAIEKRIGRARNVFRQSGALVEIHNAADVHARLDAVQQAIYLLFNEGYHSSRPDSTVRQDLCFEAIRLADLLAQHPEANQPRTHALLALLCFHAARLSSRMDDDGNLIQLEMQDRSKWNQELIGRGFVALAQSSAGAELSAYHVEAAIASLHCAAPAYERTDWPKIVELYDLLYGLRPSPIVALNRAVAIGNARGPEAGLAELNSIAGAARLEHYPFYPAAFGEFHLRAGRRSEAAAHFERAIALARNPFEAEFFTRKLRAD